MKERIPALVKELRREAIRVWNADDIATLMTFGSPFGLEAVLNIFINTLKGGDE